MDYRIDPTTFSVWEQLSESGNNVDKKVGGTGTDEAGGLFHGADARLARRLLLFVQKRRVRLLTMPLSLAIKTFYLLLPFWGYLSKPCFWCLLIPICLSFRFFRRRQFIDGYPPPLTHSY